MDKIFCLVLSCAISSCATVPLGHFQSREVITRHGFVIAVDHELYAKGEIEAITDELIDFLIRENIYTQQEIFSALTSRANEYRIYVTKGRRSLCETPAGTERECYAFPCLGTECTGEFVGGRSITYIYNNCIANTALVHELIHFFDYAIKDYIDSGHSNPRMFAHGCMLQYSNSRTDPDNEKKREKCLRNVAEIKVNVDFYIKNYGTWCN